MHITLHPDRCYVHSEQPPGVIINGLTAFIKQRLFLFTSTSVYRFSPGDNLLLDQSDEYNTPPLLPEGWTIGHVKNF